MLIGIYASLTFHLDVKEKWRRQSCTEWRSRKARRNETEWWKFGAQKLERRRTEARKDQQIESDEAEDVTHIT